MPVDAGHPVRLTLLGREYCHLCTEMADTLRERLAAYPVTLDWVDLDLHPEWEAVYGEHIPVLRAGAVEICRHRLDEAALGAFLARFG